MSRRTEWINGLRAMPISGNGIDVKPLRDAWNRLPKRAWSNDPYAVLRTVGHAYPKTDPMPIADVPITMVPVAEALPPPPEYIIIRPRGR